ncbi:hypothetical protein BH10ACT11_BH10ACT11_09370 [soil metagenome]
MKYTSRLLAALTIGAVLFVVGCGGGSDDSTTSGASGASGSSGASSSTPALSKDEFITNADQICETGNSAIDSAAQSLGQNPSPADLSKFVDTILAPTLETEFDGIDGVTPPEGDEDQITAITDAGRSGLVEIKDDPSKLQASGADSPFAEANKLAQAYGLKICGAG